MSFSFWWRARKWVASGYQPVSAVQASATWLVGPAPGGPVEEPLVVVFCPTVITSDIPSDRTPALDQLIAHVAALRQARPDRRFLLWLGVQGDAPRLERCGRRVQAAASACRNCGVPFGGFVQRRVGKVRSLNVALEEASALRASAFIQVDDDVYLEPGCLDEVLRAYEAKGGDAVTGASKVPVRRRSRTSAALRWLRGRTGHACGYPHGCCIALDPRSPMFPIPERYTTDDGYICFAALRPHAADPLEALMVVPTATCRYFVGGALRESSWRIRRMLLDIHVLLADFPRATSEYYFRHLLFAGLWPIGAPLDASRTSSVRWLLRFIYYLMFSGVGLELIARGLVRRPLRQIAWAGLSQRDAPVPPAVS